MRYYYIPLDIDGYPIGDEAFEKEDIAYDSVKDYMGENGIHREMYNHGKTEEIEVSHNEKTNQYECISVGYPDAAKRGLTEEDAIHNFINSIR